MKIKNVSQIEKFSIRVANNLDFDDCIFLFGEIGVGKTTFVRYLINYLEKQNNIKESHVLSPTFNIVYDYYVKSYKFMHYDLYRIKSIGYLEQLGIFEDKKKSIKIIEWPELITNKIKDRLELYFSYEKELDSRYIKILGFGKWKGFHSNEI